MNGAKISALVASVLCILPVRPASLDARSSPSPVATGTIVERAAAAYSTSVQGVIGMQRHFSTVISGGPIHHTEVSDSGLLLNDGAFVRIKYYRVVRDGKSFSTHEIVERETQANRDWGLGKVFFKEPYDRRFIADYHFADVAQCVGCANGTVAVRFTSLIHDAQHGSGTMWINTSNARVEKLTYVPYALPPHATSGSVTETSAQVLDGRWFVTRIDEVYTGRAFILSGKGTFTGTIDHFRHFTSLQDGERALTGGTL